MCPFKAVTMVEFKFEFDNRHLYNISRMFDGQNQQQDYQSNTLTEISQEKMFYWQHDSNPLPSCFSWALPSLQGFVSLRSIILALLVAINLGTLQRWQKRLLVGLQ